MGALLAPLFRGNIDLSAMNATAFRVGSSCRSLCCRMAVEMCFSRSGLLEEEEEEVK